MKMLLRFTAFSFSLFLFSLDLRSQWVSIPDTNFATFLNIGILSPCLQGNNQVGWQMDTTCPQIASITMIDCSSNSSWGGNIHDLTGIQYFDNLEILICFGNFLTELPPLPEGLFSLDCGYNQLSTLPELPKGLLYLGCYSNQLTSLPMLPDSLLHLWCDDNQLTNLPALPAGLPHLSCRNNQLIALPALPDSMALCYVDNNPLNCFPYLKRIHTLTFTATNITCVPNVGNVTVSIPRLDTIPICNSTNNPNGCELYSSVREVKGGVSEFRVYPNPAANTILLSNITLHTSITITNLLGEVMIKDIAESERKEIDISRLPSGMYFINNKRFVKE